jgi:hypothetical protein
MPTIKKLLQDAPRMRGVTPVPMGPLVKKKGQFKGSTLKNGGNVSCWTGYVKKGTKKKGGKTVNNCVKKKK